MPMSRQVLKKRARARITAARDVVICLPALFVTLAHFSPLG